MLPPFFKSISYFKLNYYNSSDNHYYEKFEDGTINDITEEIPFEIPESWCWLRMNNCADVYTGNSISESIKKSKYTGISEGYNYIGTKDVNFDNSITYDNGVKIPFNETKFRNAYKNNTLICVEGGSAGRKVAILDEDVCFGNKLATINSWIINSQYIYLVFQSSIIQNFFRNNMTGIIGGVSINKLKTFLIPIPSLEEQARIVEKYKLFIPLINSYNNEYCKLETLNDNYKEDLKKSILQYAIQGKFVKQDPDDESAEVLISKILDKKRELIKNKQIKKENLSVIYKDSTDNQFYEKFDDGKIFNITDEIPFEIPDSWQWTRLRNITTIKGGKRLPVGSKFSNEITNHIYIRVTDMQNQTILDNDIQYISNNVYEKIKQYTISQDDLYIVIVGSTIGKVGKVPPKFNNMNLTENAAKLVFSKLDKNYLLMLLLSDFSQNQFVDKTKQVGVPKLALTRLGNTLICFPPLEEQKRIVNKLNQIFNYIETAE